MAVRRLTSGVRYFKLPELSDGNLNWIDSGHIASVESDEIETLDLLSIQVTDRLRQDAAAAG